MMVILSEETGREDVRVMASDVIGHEVALSVQRRMCLVAQEAMAIAGQVGGQMPRGKLEREVQMLIDLVRAIKDEIGDPPAPSTVPHEEQGGRACGSKERE